MGKKYLKINVYEAAIKRIEYLFSEFDNILVAFSGGKDSSVCLNLCYDYAKNQGMLNKLSYYHLDYEAQYQMTTDFVSDTFSRYKDINGYWLCLPVAADCCCSMTSGTWTVWDESKKNLWVRNMPADSRVVNIGNVPFQMRSGERDYDIQDRFSDWFESAHGNTATVIGIRSDESLNRYRSVSSDKVSKYKNNSWINGHKAYPIYDWTVNDIWTYNAKFEKPYNHLYDLYYQAGLSFDQMRVASPFHSCGQATLKLYKVIDPANWGRMVSRVNGVNFAGLYGGTTAMGWKKITKPDSMTWKEYCYFLLDTLDAKTKKHYEDKLSTSLEFWKNKGGCLDDETISELKSEGSFFHDKGNISNYKTDKKVISFDDYLDDTSVKKFKDVPTYKRMCVCILKNDYFCKYMGFSQTKQEREKRRSALERYKAIL